MSTVGDPMTTEVGVNSLSILRSDPAIDTDDYAGLDNSIQLSQVGRLIALSRGSNSVTQASHQEESSERQDAPV